MVIKKIQVMTNCCRFNLHLAAGLVLISGSVLTVGEGWRMVIHVVMVMRRISMTMVGWSL